MDFLKPFRQFGDFLRQNNPFQGQTYYIDVKQPQAVRAAEPIATPTSTPVPTATPYAFGQNLRQNFTPESIRQGITDSWGSDTPILNNINELYQAGQQLPANYDPYLPTILALRETQGGKDLAKRDFGKNNPYNIRGIQNGKTQFINYPDFNTATFGGQNGDVTAQGLVNLLAKNPLYADFQRTGDPRDLFKVWSPPNDGNGSLDDPNDPRNQINNYNWIRGRFK